MILALILFALIYILMLALPQQRPFVALGGNLTLIGASANIALETGRTKQGASGEQGDLLHVNHIDIPSFFRVACMAQKGRFEGAGRSVLLPLL